jgi:enoyl-CoA hydratase/carnithine racemase
MSGSSREIVLEIDRRAPGSVIARLTIDRAARLNALSTPVMEAFVAAVDEAGREPGLRALVVTGAGGKAFVGGADIDEMAGLDRESAIGLAALLDPARQSGRMENCS